MISSTWLTMPMCYSTDPRRMPVVAEVASERLTMRPRTSNMRTRNRSGERRSSPRCFWSRGAGLGGHDLWNATLLRLGMGCLVGAADPAVELRSERREAVDILAGEEEDGVGEDKPPDGAVEPKSGQMEPLPPGPAEDRATTTKQMAKRRRSLVRALTLFETWLAAAATDYTIGVDDVPAKVSFILRLMAAAMRVRHCMEDGTIVTLMAMEPVNEDRKLSVATQSIAVLRDVWLGRGPLPPVAQRLSADTRRARIPIEVSQFAVFCRWIAARCVCGIQQHPEHARLAKLLEKTAVRIVASTFCLGLPRSARRGAASSPTGGK